MDAWSSNYPEFLNAFLKGEVTRLVVVERLENPPGPKVASGYAPTLRVSSFCREGEGVPDFAVVNHACDHSGAR